jgi:hypothetical protein
VTVPGPDTELSGPGYRNMIFRTVPVAFPTLVRGPITTPWIGVNSGNLP